jgi:hypothetical protein
LKVLFDFIVGFEGKGVYEVGLLWPFEDEVGEVGEKGVEAGLHTSHHLNFSR